MKAAEGIINGVLIGATMWAVIVLAIWLVWRG